MIVLVMGVSGAGKSTVGAALAARLGWPFIDADDHHPAANIAKMTAGIPLEDGDRWPWLDRLNELLRGRRDAVLACSALKESYRARLGRGLGEIATVHLHGAQELIAARLAARAHRYMPASLLPSQFAALEPPAHAIRVEVSADAEACVEQILARLPRAV